MPEPPKFSKKPGIIDTIRTHKKKAIKHIKHHTSKIIKKKQNTPKNPELKYIKHTFQENKKNEPKTSSHWRSKLSDLQS